MRIAVVVSVVLALACSSSGQPRPSLDAIRYSGGTGTSCEDAVVIHAPDTSTGVAAEYLWLAHHYPGYTKLRQSVGRCGRGVADSMQIETRDGEVLMVVFEITSFFGKH